jgi:hypothetical protein
MISRDYTKELGMCTAQPVVPLPLVIALVGLIAAGGWYGFSTFKPAGHGHEAAKTAAAAPAAPAVASK